MPERIANAPEVSVGLELYYLAFLDLTTSRTQGYAEGPISWLSIADYADRAELSDEQREDMFYFVNEMDVAYLKYRGDKIAASTSQVS